VSEKQLAVVEIERLERIVAGDAAAPAFPALAEAHRRSGDPKRAEEVARAGLAYHPDHVAGGVALGLALIAQGRSKEACSVLEHTLEATPEHVLAQRALEELGGSPRTSAIFDGLDSELDAAFALARPEAEVMVDANDLAHEALRRADAAPEEAVELVTAEGSPFATRTVADLLERQGDHGHADALRRSLGEKARRSDEERRRRVVATLEGWLLKLRGGESR
jgi:tetratricopeptide (TPR) repeat protein